jgi:hypothetical protein
MSVYKQLTTADTIVTPFEVNKTFTFKGKNNFSGSNIGIDLFLGNRLTESLFISSSFSTTGLNNNQFQDLVHQSIRHLYYSNYISQSFGDNANTASFNIDDTITGVRDTTNNYNYLSNTLTQSRALFPGGGNKIGVLSIPRSLFGEHIKPGSFLFDDGTYKFTDDKEGNIFTRTNIGETHVGNIIYEHGLAIFTYKLIATGSSLSNTQGIATSFSRENLTCSFDSTKTIYEAQFMCNLNESEFNYSLNPTIISASDGSPFGYVSSSFFDPYITTIGLYNNSLDLIAVGKLAQPTPKSKINDTNIIINLDMY